MHGRRVSEANHRMKASWHAISLLFVVIHQFGAPTVHSAADFPCLASIFLLSRMSHQVGQSTKTVWWVKLLLKDLRGFIQDVFWWIQPWPDKQPQVSVKQALVSSALFVTELVASSQNERFKNVSKLRWKGRTWMNAGLTQQRCYFPFIGFIEKEKKSSIWREIYFLSSF